MCVEHLQHTLCDAQISKLTEMGFPRDAAIAALEASDGNENAALEYLLGGGP